FDVVAEHPVVADLQRADAGPRSLAQLHLRDDLLPGAADRLELIELAVDAVARETAVAGERGRVVDDRSLDRVAHIREVVELGDKQSRERPLQLGEHRADAWNRGERLLQPDEIARAGRAERRARDETLEILYAFESFAKLAAVGRAERQLF